VRQLNEIALLHSEANVRIDHALRLAMLIEHSAVSNWWPYRDTIAWVLYRAGFPKSALALLTHELPDEAMEDLGVLYHLRFILKAMGATSSSTAVRTGFETQLLTKRFEDESVDFTYALEYKRMHTGASFHLP
jgi:hypothetical protein